MDLKEMQARIERKKQLEIDLPKLRERSYKLEEQEKILKVRLEYEKSDVDALEGNNLKSLFYTVLGKKQEKLNREYDEADAAQEEYDAVAKALADAQKAVRKAEAELRMLSNCEKEYENAIKEQSARWKELLQNADPKLSEQFAGLEEEIALCCRMQEHFEKAIEEGEKAEYLAEAVMESLRQAADESAHERNMAKHEELDEAQARLEVLQRQLQRFNEFLSDKEIQANMQISVTGFWRYADILTDSNSGDGFRGHLGSYIYRSEYQIEKVSRDLRTTLDDLRENREKAHQRELSAKAAISDLIEKQSN